MVDSVSLDISGAPDASVEPAPQAPENVTLVDANGKPTETPNPEDAPAGRPEKFKTDEDWRKHYDMLQAESTKKAMGEKTDESLEVKPDANAPLPSEAMSNFANEYAEKGELSDGSYKELSTKYGLTKDIVDGYIEGQRALAQTRVSTVQSSVGGPENYKVMGEWARENYTAEQLETYNSQVNSPDINVAQVAVKALKADYVAANGSEPTLVKGSSNHSSGSKFESGAQVTAAMKDPRYATDEAYRKEVEGKLSRSTFMDSGKTGLGS